MLALNALKNRMTAQERQALDDRRNDPLRRMFNTMIQAAMNHPDPNGIIEVPLEQPKKKFRSGA